MTKKILMLLCLLLITFCLSSCEGLDSLLELVNEHYEVTTVSIVDDNSSVTTNELGEDHNHNYRLVYDNKAHFYVCTICGDIYNRNDHDIDSTGKCSVCGYSTRLNPYTITLSDLAGIATSLQNVQVNYTYTTNQHNNDKDYKNYYKSETGTLKIQKGTQIIVDSKTNYKYDLTYKDLTPYMLRNYNYSTTDSNTFKFDYTLNDNYYIWLDEVNNTSYFTNLENVNSNSYSYNSEYYLLSTDKENFLNNVFKFNVSDIVNSYSKLSYDEATHVYSFSNNGLDYRITFDSSKLNTLSINSNEYSLNLSFSNYGRTSFSAPYSSSSIVNLCEHTNCGLLSKEELNGVIYLDAECYNCGKELEYVFNSNNDIIKYCDDFDHEYCLRTNIKDFNGNITGALCDHCIREGHTHINDAVFCDVCHMAPPQYIYYEGNIMASYGYNGNGETYFSIYQPYYDSSSPEYTDYYTLYRYKLEFYPVEIEYYFYYENLSQEPCFYEFYNEYNVYINGELYGTYPCRNTYYSHDLHVLSQYSSGPNNYALIRCNQCGKEEESLIYEINYSDDYNHQIITTFDGYQYVLSSSHIDNDKNTICDICGHSMPITFDFNGYELNYVVGHYKEDGSLEYLDILHANSSEYYYYNGMDTTRYSWYDSDYYLYQRWEYREQLSDCLYRIYYEYYLTDRNNNELASVIGYKDAFEHGNLSLVDYIVQDDGTLYGYAQCSKCGKTIEGKIQTDGYNDNVHYLTIVSYEDNRFNYYSLAGSHIDQDNDSVCDICRCPNIISEFDFNGIVMPYTYARYSSDGVFEHLDIYRCSDSIYYNYNGMGGTRFAWDGFDYYLYVRDEYQIELGGCTYAIYNEYYLLDKYDNELGFIQGQRIMTDHYNYLVLTDYTVNDDGSIYGYADCRRCGLSIEGIVNVYWFNDIQHEINIVSYVDGEYRNNNFVQSHIDKDHDKVCDICGGENLIYEYEVNGERIPNVYPYYNEDGSLSYLRIDKYSNSYGSYYDDKPVNVYAWDNTDYKVYEYSNSYNDSDDECLYHDIRIYYIYSNLFESVIDTLTIETAYYNHYNFSLISSEILDDVILVTAKCSRCGTKVIGTSYGSYSFDSYNHYLWFEYDGRGYNTSESHIDKDHDKVCDICGSTNFMEELRIEEYNLTLNYVYPQYDGDGKISSLRIRNYNNRYYQYIDNVYCQIYELSDQNYSIYIYDSYSYNENDPCLEIYSKNYSVLDNVTGEFIYTIECNKQYNYNHVFELDSIEQSGEKYIITATCSKCMKQISGEGSIKSSWYETHFFNIYDESDKTYYDVSDYHIDNDHDRICDICESSNCAFVYSINGIVLENVHPVYDEYNNVVDLNIYNCESISQDTIEGEYYTVYEWHNSDYLLYLHDEAENDGCLKLYKRDYFVIDKNTKSVLGNESLIQRSYSHNLKIDSIEVIDGVTYIYATCLKCGEQLSGSGYRAYNNEQKHYYYIDGINNDLYAYGQHLDDDNDGCCDYCGSTNFVFPYTTPLGITIPNAYPRYDREYNVVGLDIYDNITQETISIDYKPYQAYSWNDFDMLLCIHDEGEVDGCLYTCTHNYLLLDKEDNSLVESFTFVENSYNHFYLTQSVVKNSDAQYEISAKCLECGDIVNGTGYISGWDSYHHYFGIDNSYIGGSLLGYHIDDDNDGCCDYCGTRDCIIPLSTSSGVTLDFAYPNYNPDNSLGSIYFECVVKDEYIEVEGVTYTVYTLYNGYRIYVNESSRHDELNNCTYYIYREYKIYNENDEYIETIYGLGKNYTHNYYVVNCSKANDNYYYYLDIQCEYCNETHSLTGSLSWNSNRYHYFNVVIDDRGYNVSAIHVDEDGDDICDICGCVHFLRLFITNGIIFSGVSYKLDENNNFEWLSIDNYNSYSTRDIDGEYYSIYTWSNSNQRVYSTSYYDEILAKNYYKYIFVIIENEEEVVVDTVEFYV